MDLRSHLLEFVDGNLAPEQEEQLFFHLSVNVDLRAALKNLLRLEQSLQQSDSQFRPSAATTTALFNKLNIAAPAAALPSQSQSALRRLLLSAALLRPYRQGIIAAALTGLTLLTIWFAWLRPAVPVTTNSALAIAPTAAEQSTPPAANPASAVKAAAPSRPTTPVFDPEMASATGSNKTKGRLGAADAGTDAPTGAENKSVVSSQPPSLAVLRPTPYLMEGLHRPGASAVMTTGERAAVFADNRVFAPTLGRSTPFSIELRATPSWTMPGATIAPAQLSELHNTALGLFYAIDGNWSLGFELRQETFFQEFDGRNAFGLPVRWEQQPNFTSYGLALRYESGQENPLRPFAQLAGGANRGGYVGRALFGGKLALNNSVSLMLAAEVSSLLFWHQGSAFTANKLGLHYGLSFGW